MVAGGEGGAAGQLGYRRVSPSYLRGLSCTDEESRPDPDGPVPEQARQACPVLFYVTKYIQAARFDSFTRNLSWRY
jgi:hypothetical protein